MSIATAFLDGLMSKKHVRDLVATVATVAANTAAILLRAPIRPWAVVTGDITVASWSRTLFDSTAGARIATLPAAPADGDVVTIARKGAANNVTIARNGKLINGLAEDLVLNLDETGAELTYVNSTLQWSFTAFYLHSY